MQVVYERCAAIDVHQETAVTTILITQANGHVQKETRTFATMTGDLLRLDDWLHELDVTVVAMESTGVFWHPIFNILEEGREIILVNAQHMKAVPGRKTDVKDSEWLADLTRAWVAASELYSAQANTGIAGTDPLPQDAGAGTQSRGQPAAKSVRGSKHQIGGRGYRCVRQEWTRHARSHDGWRAGCRSVGCSGPRTAARQAARSASCLRRTHATPSSVPAATHSGACGLSGSVHSPGRTGDRAAPAPF